MTRVGFGDHPTEPRKRGRIGQQGHGLATESKDTAMNDKSQAGEKVGAASTTKLTARPVRVRIEISKTGRQYFMVLNDRYVGSSNTREGAMQWAKSKLEEIE